MTYLVSFFRKTPPVRLFLYAALLAVGCLALWARFFRLSLPNNQVFDEVYFPVFAWNYMHGIQSFDAHPPFGKFIITLSLFLWGNTTLGWRIMPALFGSLLVGLMPWLWWRYAKDRAGSLFLLCALATEPFLVTYSRLGLMDGVLLFFIMAAFFSMVTISNWRKILWPATLLGLSAAIKWIGLGVVVPMLYIAWRRKMLKPFLASLLWSGLVYLSVVLAGNVLGHVPNVWSYVREWHWQAYHYHVSLTATHPWGSKWWSWPLMLRPILMSNASDGHGKLMIISAIGNPVLWYSASLAVLLSIFRIIKGVWKKGWKEMADHPLVPLLLGYFAFYLPWIIIPRVLFLYHYLPCYGFALLMLAYWVGRLWNREPIVAVAYTVCVVAAGIFYLPMGMGWPALSDSALQSRLWLDNVASWWHRNHILEGTAVGRWLDTYLWSFSWYWGAS